MDTDHHFSATPGFQIPPSEMWEGRTGWICQSLRLASVAYPAWVLYLLVAAWSSPAHIAEGWGRLLHRNLSQVAGWQRAAAFAVETGVWLVLVLACIAGFRLFSAYLRGRVFTPDAAAELRRIATFGIAAQVLGILSRPIVALILTWDASAGEGGRSLFMFVQQSDVLVLVLLAALLAFAHVQQVAAELARDHAQIV